MTDWLGPLLKVRVEVMVSVARQNRDILIFEIEANFPHHFKKKATRARVGKTVRELVSIKQDHVLECLKKFIE